jgi:hypothetical protein
MIWRYVKEKDGKVNFLFKIRIMVQTFWHETASDEEFITSALIKLIIANLSLSCAFMKLNFNPMFIAYKYGWVDRALEPKKDKLINWRFVKEKYGKAKWIT